MRRTRSRELAALVVVGALLVTALEPALLASARVGESAGPVGATNAPPAADLAVLAGEGATAAPVDPHVPQVDRRPPDERLAAPVPAPLPRCAPPPADLAGAPVRSHGSRTTKLVALTFDDGYNPKTTLRILDVLRHSHVNATFFVTGRAVALFPGVWREVVTAGYPIADHTYDHKRLAGLCFETQVRELTRQADVLREALGIEPVALMRPPYGIRDRFTARAARAAGDAAVVLWDVDTRDWSGLSAGGVARRALAGGNGSIVLMHTLYANTAAALPRIIAGYRARGFTFVTVGQLLGVPGPVPFG